MMLQISNLKKAHSEEITLIIFSGKIGPPT